MRHREIKNYLTSAVESLQSDLERSKAENDLDYFNLVLEAISKLKEARELISEDLKKREKQNETRPRDLEAH